MSDPRFYVNRTLNYSQVEEDHTSYSVVNVLKMDDKIVCKHRKEPCPALKSQEQANNHHEKYFHFSSRCANCKRELNPKWYKYTVTSFGTAICCNPDCLQEYLDFD